jgi:glyoxylase-like metal-dependent hydrolase (beta-lactamase superfamily II)
MLGPVTTRNPNVDCIFHQPTNTCTYVVADTKTGTCVVIDPVLDFFYNSGTTKTDTANKVLELINQKGYHASWILETHVHADHLTAAPYLKEKLGAKIAIGENITKVQQYFAKLLNLSHVSLDGSQWDHLWKDGETFEVGTLQAKVLYTPGHTPSCVSYLIGDALFCGDTLFMPDFGTARCDFPGGSAHELYNSIMNKIYKLPDDTRIFVGHDYPPSTRSFQWESTVGQQKKENKHLKASTSQAEFVAMREGRDKALPLPNLIWPSLQVNINAGRLPPPEINGISYLKVPLNVFEK